MAPTSDKVERTFFLWNNTAVSDLGLDKNAILEATMPLFDRPEDQVQWSL